MHAFMNASLERAREMDDDDGDDDDDRSRRTNGRAPALPQILRQWATHHVGAFVEDADSSEHILSSDYDGNALGAEARRAIHEEARRRGVRAKSVDLANGTRAVALTRRANEDEDEDEDGDETATRRRKARRVDDSDDTAEDDREDEEDARARELVGYVDLRETPFDVHAELKISKDNSNPAGRARAAYHREAIKWHPDNATPTPSGSCRACGCVLQFKRWVRARSATDEAMIDACSTCFEAATRDGGGGSGARKDADAFPELVEGERVVVESLADLGEAKSTYESKTESGCTKAMSACRKLQRLGVAFHVLKDSDRFKIYREHGYEGLVKSERYAESDVFDLDGFTMYESFFAGEDEEDRQYLLLCPEAESDDEDENDDENDDATEIDPDDEIEALMTSENVESLKNAPRKPSAVNDAADDDFPAPPLAALAAPPTTPRFAEDPWAELASRIA